MWQQMNICPKKVQEPLFAFEGSFLFTRQTPLRNIECTATGSHKVLTNVTASQLHHHQMDKTQFSDFWFGG